MKNFKNDPVYLIFITLTLLLSFPEVIWAGEVEDHAPIGVMGDHTHKTGEWMTSYRYMQMDMPVNYSGSDRISTSDVNGQFMVAPESMTMSMHMIGLMYGASDQVTVMLMVPYVIKDMDHRRRDGAEFSTRTEGIGDIKLSGLISLREWIDRPIHLNMGLSFPSGSINETGDTLVGSDQDLPYPMQLGSGTYDLHPGITYIDKNERWSWGAQFLSALRTGENDHDYRLGNSYDLTSWIAYTWTDGISTSFRTKASFWGNISGADSRLNPAVVPTADAGLRGGERIDLLAGINLLSHEGQFKDQRLAFEFGYPVYQHLDGPQLGAGWQGTVGWQKAF